MAAPPDPPERLKRPIASLQSLREQYYALVPPYLLRLPPAEVLGTEEAQTFLVAGILCDEAGELPGPEVGYRRGFWRRVVGVLEEGVGVLRKVNPELELEVDERIYEAVAELMVSAPSSSGSMTEPPESHRTFLYDQPDWAASDPHLSDPSGATGAATERERERRITLLEEQVVLQAGTTGLRTWTAALHLGHHILSHPHLLFRQPSSRDDGSPLPLPREIIELGAGTGFLSILLAQLGSDVISTDLGEPDDSQGDEQTPFKRLMVNARLTKDSTGGRLRVEALDWTDALRDEMDRPGTWGRLKGQGGDDDAARPRTVVAADVIYDPDLVPPLVATIRVLIGAKWRHCHGSHEHRHSEAIIAATVRNPATLRLFQDTCEKEGLLVETLDLEPMDNDDPTFWDSGLDRSASVRIMRITPTAPPA